MKHFLIYGSKRPLGKRLTWYLQNYAEHRSKQINVVARESLPHTSSLIQKDIWENMVGPSTPSRPDIVINCDVLDEQISNTSPDVAWRTHATQPSMLAIAARGAGIPYVQISSDRVFDSHRDSAPSPSAMPKPNGIHGVTLARGESLIRKIYPLSKIEDDQPVGAFILRFSTLYGWGIENSMTAAFASNSRVIYTPSTKESPTFLGEAAFIFARNLLESPMSLTRDDGIIHVAPPDDPISMHELLTNHMKTPIKADLQERHAVGTIGHFGLEPTKGWVLSRGWEKATGDFVREFQAKGELRYW